MSRSSVHMASCWRVLGNYIELCEERNSSGLYGEDDAIGVNIDKVIRKMKGNNEEKKFDTFWIVKPGTFVFNPRGSRKLGLGYNDSGNTFITTFNNIVFRVIPSETKVLNPMFLYLYLSRKEWDRQAEYRSWGSSTEVFSWNSLCESLIPVPDISVQDEIVSVWDGIYSIKEQNESIAEPLFQLCQSMIQELKHQNVPVEIGPYIEQSDERNNSGQLCADDVRGLSTAKEIIETKANMDGVPVSSYKLVRPDDFAYVSDTSRRGDKVSMGYNSTPDTFLVSSISTVFHSRNKEVLLPEYLLLWFKRTEFDRYARFHSWGSARETFVYEDMERVRIPLPDIKVQQAIVDIFNCAQRAKQIAIEAERLCKEICPALMQKAINS